MKNNEEIDAKSNNSIGPNNELYSHLREAYGLSDENIKKIIEFRNYLATEKKSYWDYDKLIEKMKWAMNFNEMQIWLLENYYKGVKTTFDEEVAKFFELTEFERIAITFSILENVNKANIEDARNAYKNYYSRKRIDESNR